MNHYKLCFFGLIIFAGILNACQSSQIQNMETRELDSNWIYHQVNGDISGNASIPGTIHTDLLANKQIEDPFYRVNEKKTAMD